MAVMETAKVKARPAAKISSEIVTVTPELAKSWLERNTHNRKISEATVRKFMRDMKAGQWKMTGDAIRFDTAGTLIDGQHRLAACIRSNTTFESFVIYGLMTESQDVMDTGKSRSASDVLTLRGIMNAQRVQGILRCMLTYKEGTASKPSITTAEIVDALGRHPLTTRSASLVHNLPRRTTPVTPLGFVHYAVSVLLNKTNEANQIVDVFKTGIPAFDNDPVHLLRERLLRIGEDNARVPIHVVYWTLYHQTNLFLAGTPSFQLRWQKSPVSIEGLDSDLL